MDQIRRKKSQKLGKLAKNASLILSLMKLMAAAGIEPITGYSLHGSVNSKREFTVCYLPGKIFLINGIVYVLSPYYC